MNKVIVETSAHHIHITDEDLEILFGKGAKLTKKKDLSQPGQFACFERVDIVGPKNTIKNMSILGPTRSKTQVEISLTEARKIGVDAPIKQSGDVAGSAGCKVVGPKGEIEISEGVIAAARHIHLTPEDAQKFGIKDNQKVAIEINNDVRSVVFKDVIARVNENFSTAVHLDTDESNAAGLKGTVEANLIVE